MGAIRRTTDGTETSEEAARIPVGRRVHPGSGVRCMGTLAVVGQRDDLA
jgi:hypothetical protein